MTRSVTTMITVRHAEKLIPATSNEPGIGSSIE